MPRSFRPAERRALTRRYQTALTTITARTLPVIGAAWNDLTSYRDPDIEAFTAATAPITTAAKGAAVLVASSYYASILSVPALSIDPTAVPVDFYARKPFLATWNALNDGKPLEEAASIGLGQAEAAGANLVISSARQAGDEFASKSDSQVTGWQRVAEADCCDWCSNLDGVIFGSAESADFGHDRCHCVPEPFEGWQGTSFA